MKLLLDLHAGLDDCSVCDGDGCGFCGDVSDGDEGILMEWPALYG